MNHHRDFFSDSTRDQLALNAVVYGTPYPEDGIARALRLHREAAERRGHKCRLCGKPSALATCAECLDEAGW